jgi:hypothetical protein
MKPFSKYHLKFSWAAAYDRAAAYDHPFAVYNIHYNKFHSSVHDLDEQKYNEITEYLDNKKRFIHDAYDKYVCEDIPLPFSTTKVKSMNEKINRGALYLFPNVVKLSWEIYCKYTKKRDKK